jgi:hypothetical protein
MLAKVVFEPHREVSPEPSKVRTGDQRGRNNCVLAASLGLAPSFLRLPPRRRAEPLSSGTETKSGSPQTLPCQNLDIMHGPDQTLIIKDPRHIQTVIGNTQTPLLPERGLHTRAYELSAGGSYQAVPQLPASAAAM